MKRYLGIAVVLALAATAFGQTCSPPTPVFNPPVVPGGLSEPWELHGFAKTTAQTPTFVEWVDMYGNAPLMDCQAQTLTRTTDSNTFLGIVPTPSDYLVVETGLQANQFTTVNQWSMNAVNKQITGQTPCTDFNHEAIRLPGGLTAAICHENEVITSTTQCVPTSQFPGNVCEVLGDKVVVMDTGGNIRWIWDSFNQGQFPYINRRAILGETCTATKNNGGCPSIPPFTVVQDWLHSNSLWYDPVDGNLVLNIRNQDWIVKLNYQNGNGDGSVVWRLGNQGDFTMSSSVKAPSPWQDHPHDVTSPVAGTYTMFDNGNGRHQSAGGGYSRGLAYTINEAKRTVTSVTLYPLKVFSPGSGSAQTLVTSGNIVFTAGRPQYSDGTIYSEEFEFVPGTTTPVFTEILPEQYRSIRLTGPFFPQH